LRRVARSLSPACRWRRFGATRRCIDRAIFRRKAIYEELHPETKAGTAGATTRWGGKDDATANFAAATADATGKAERTVRLAAARGEALGDDLAAVTGTSLDKGVELDALARNSGALSAGPGQ
jgi:hypothetical protein